MNVLFCLQFYLIYCNAKEFSLFGGIYEEFKNILFVDYDRVQTRILEDYTIVQNYREV